MPSYIAKGISSLLKGNTKTAENSLSAASRSNTRPFLKDNPDITTNTIVPNDSNYIENLTDVEQKYRLSKKEFDNQAPFGQAVQSFRNMFTDDIIQDQRYAERLAKRESQIPPANQKVITKLNIEDAQATNPNQRNIQNLNPNVKTFNSKRAKEHFGEGRDSRSQSNPGENYTGAIHPSMRLSTTKQYNKRNQTMLDPENVDSVAVLDGPVAGFDQIGWNRNNSVDNQYIVNLSTDVPQLPIVDSRSGQMHYSTEAQRNDLSALQIEEAKAVNGYARVITTEYGGNLINAPDTHTIIAQYQDNLTGKYIDISSKLEASQEKVKNSVSKLARALTKKYTDSPDPGRILKALSEGKGSVELDVMDILAEEGFQKLTRSERAFLTSSKSRFDDNTDLGYLRNLENNKKLQVDDALQELSTDYRNRKLALQEYNTTYKPNPAVQDRAMRNVVRKSIQQALQTGSTELRWVTGSGVRTSPNMRFPIPKAKQTYDKDMVNQVYQFVKDAGLMTNKEATKSQQYLRNLQKNLPHRPALPDDIRTHNDAVAWTEKTDINGISFSPPSEAHKKYTKEYKAYLQKMDEFKKNYDHDYSKNNGQLIDLVYDKTTDSFQYSLKLNQVAKGGEYSVKTVSETKGIPLFGTVGIGAGIDQVTNEAQATTGGDPSNAQVDQERAVTTPNQTSTESQGTKADKSDNLESRIQAQRKPAYQDRIDNPQDYGVVNNADGSISTHRMATAEQNGKHYAFPTIVQIPESGGLYEFKDSEWKDAFAFNMKTGNVKQFDTAEAAENYSKNYKTDAFNGYYKQRNQNTPYQHPSYKGGGGQTMNPNDAFKGGLQAAERGLKRIPGSYGELIEMVAPYSSLGMIVEAITGDTLLGDAPISTPIHEAMGVNDLPEPTTPWQKTVGLTSEIGGDITGLGLATKAYKGGKALINDGMDHLDGIADEIRVDQKLLSEGKDVNPILDESRRNFMKKTAATGAAATLGLKGIASVVPEAATAVKTTAAAAQATGGSGLSLMPYHIFIEKHMDSIMDVAQTQADEFAEMGSFGIGSVIDDAVVDQSDKLYDMYRYSKMDEVAQKLHPKDLSWVKDMSGNGRIALVTKLDDIAYNKAPVSRSNEKAGAKDLVRVNGELTKVNYETRVRMQKEAIDEWNNIKGKLKGDTDPDQLLEFLDVYDLHINSKNLPTNPENLKNLQKLDTDIPDQEGYDIVRDVMLSAGR